MRLGVDEREREREQREKIVEFSLSLSLSRSVVYIRDENAVTISQTLVLISIIYLSIHGFSSNKSE